MISCGLDFGTSNSTAGLSDAHGSRLVALEGESVVLPSAVFFDTEDQMTRFGRDAVDAYIARHEGRLLRALKSILGSGLMDETTQVGDRRVAFTSVIGQFVRQLKACVEQEAGKPVEQVVMGRPVHFVDGDEAADSRAEAQLGAIARAQGFTSVEFQYEPVAAALAYEAGLAGEELVLVCDVGGGTSDFSLVRVGPERARKPDRRPDILANTGVHVGGTDLDFRLVINQVMKSLGLGSQLRLSTGGETAMPVWPWHDLATWHRIVFLYTPRVQSDLDALRAAALDPVAMDRLIAVVRQRNGHRLAGAVEAAKIGLSSSEAETVALDFVEPGLALPVTRARFEPDIANEVTGIERALAECLRRGRVRSSDIDAIFLTGGSTAVPAVFDACTKAAGSARVVQGDKFGSVGLGLALDAAARFGR